MCNKYNNCWTQGSALEEPYIIYSRPRHQTEDNLSRVWKLIQSTSQRAEESHIPGTSFFLLQSLFKVLLVLWILFILAFIFAVAWVRVRQGWVCCCFGYAFSCLVQVGCVLSVEACIHSCSHTIAHTWLASLNLCRGRRVELRAWPGVVWSSLAFGLFILLPWLGRTTWHLRLASFCFHCSSFLCLFPFVNFLILYC